MIRPGNALIFMVFYLTYPGGLEKGRPLFAGREGLLRMGRPMFLSLMNLSASKLKRA